MTPPLNSAFRKFVRARWERRGFARTRPVPCDTSRLVRGITRSNLGAIFRSDRLESEWRAVFDGLAQAKIAEGAVGGVNPGDRRAIFYLIRHLEPESVLEIGTHIGASTIHIAAALARVSPRPGAGIPSVTTVDVVDVNDPRRGIWLKHGSAHAPFEIARRLGLEEHVQFVVGRSLDHLAGADERYDFIFLDGDHSAPTVYREIPAALRALKPHGAILLHDYFPELRPLWPNGGVIPGPWRAVERLRSEGADVEAVPLGELPWPTKLGTRTTSLALLVRAGKA
jgi:predicted O-methyltransferase YrrM